MRAIGIAASNVAGRRRSKRFAQARSYKNPTNPRRSILYASSSIPSDA